MFDLHCDTLFELEKNGRSLVKSGLSVSLENMCGYDRFIRFFAVFTPDTLSGKAARNHFNRLYSVFERQIELFSRNLIRISDGKSLSKCKVGAILSVENANVLVGDIKEIERLAKLGVKLITLTWNGENQLGFGQLKNCGLKPFGRECVPVFEQNGIIIDVSHLSDRGFEDVCALAKKPFIASHSNCRTVCGSKRNLCDEQIEEIISRKGLIGLNFYKNFLNNQPQDASCTDILRHTDKILSLGGEDAICLGTDFDGAEIIEDFDNDEKLSGLFSLFIGAGYSEKLANKILFENAYRFFGDYI